MRSRFTLCFFLLAITSFASSLPTNQTENLRFNTDSFLLVTKGILEGIEAVESWTQLAPCITSSEDAVQNIIAAVQDFRKQDAIDVARGLYALTKAIEDLPVSIKSCGAEFGEFETLVTAIHALANPATFAFVVSKNLFVNGVDIYHEVYTAVGDFETGKWEQFGLNIGEALGHIFLHGANHPRLDVTFVEEVFLFLRGAVEGISTDIAYNELAPCLTHASSVGILLDQAMSDFITAQPTKVMEGVLLLARALRAIPEAMQGCKVAYTQFEQLLNAISLMEDPRAIVYHIARSLIIHGQETWDEITDAVNNMKMGKYEAAGRDIGVIIANFIKPDNAVSGIRFTKFLEQRAPFVVKHDNIFANWTIGELKSLMGTRIEDKSQSKIPIASPTPLNTEFPENFSAWTQWPQCEHPILDQAKCGSCWAFGAAETLSDRFCIASGGKVNKQLSPQYLVSCSTGNFGCKGGILTLAWASLERSGLPTLECTPYQSQAGDSPSCSKIEEGCQDGTPLKRYYAKSWSTRWYTSKDSMKAEIMKNGPVESAFTVYEDFMSYAGGIYKHTSGSVLGGHAIKIIGWGKENGQEYWLVANSWGTKWGIQGYFKMAMGSDMDGNGIAGTADLSNLPTQFPSSFSEKVYMGA